MFPATPIRSALVEAGSNHAFREHVALTQFGKIAAIVAHEVRNPLAGLKAGLQVIGPRVPDAGDRLAIAEMIQRIDDLNAKVDDLLLYAAPRLPRPQPVELSALMLDVADKARAAVNPRAAPIAVLGEGTRAWADVEMLRAAMLNLALNALQAAASGEVDVVVSGDADGCRIVVRDRGPGIPDEIRDRLFEPFVTSRAHGTGLGLAVAKRLIELQGGTIALEHRPGGGTMAEVRLPRAA